MCVLGGVICVFGGVICVFGGGVRVFGGGVGHVLVPPGFPGGLDGVASKFGEQKLRAVTTAVKITNRDSAVRNVVRNMVCPCVDIEFDAWRTTAKPTNGCRHQSAKQTTN